MKDTIITAKRKKTEIITFIACFLLANIVNLYAIIHYKTPMKELFTQLGYVLLFTIGLYVGWSILRIVFYYAKRLFTKQKR
ncbi:hypothetical protein M2480_002505 [Parabacteroides sp. PFB2-12]|uniref:hypothetical protein n=1 Tax=unclassified Parabacteroides TaxID=2649774 RepID=UPI0024745248|nr:MULTISPECIES: hypothetical protein [unclassified Parabacteroides]MDH6342722.1 hypothetical protein [Parabacteroides sp. PM6-13]MDH6391510.1 hypothetical protein [Parabacteroides sp. PFB2-12]